MVAIYVPGSYGESLPGYTSEETEMFISHGEWQKAAYGNLALVAFVVNRQFSRCPHDPNDLFQVGCVGLMKAVRNFDPEYGVKFSTYAVPVITGTIRQYISRNNIIRMGGMLERKRVEVAEYINAYKRKHGGYPSRDEVADAVNCAPWVVDRFYSIILAGVDHLERSAYDDDEGEPISLLEVLGGEDGTYSKIEMEDLINQQCRNDRDRQIVALRRLGLSQQDIGEQIGMSQMQVSRVLRLIRDEVAKVLRGNAQTA